MSRKLRIFGVGVAAALAIGLFGLLWMNSAGAGAATTLPSKELLVCGTCHSMEKEVQSWQNTAHKNLTCLECHREGDVNWVRHELEDKNSEMAAKLSQKTAVPIGLKVPDERCLECHATQLDALRKDVVPAPVSGKGTLPNQGKAMTVKAAHAVHLDKAKLTCVQCHTDSAHGTNKPGTTAYRDAMHNQCLECHTQKKVTISVTGSTSCTACHASAAAVAPENHKNKDQWTASHGKTAANKSCGECHLSDTAGAHTKLSSATAFPTKAGDTCAACHSGVPMPHPKDYLAVHGTASLSAKSGTCEACHTAEKNPVKPTPEHAKPGYCLDCHLQPMPHPASFLSSHGTTALNAPATCEACHSSRNVARPTAPHASKTYCSTCHDSYQHPKGWVGGHATKVDNTCATCHTLLGQQGQQGPHNACSACHTSNTATGAWHPKMFFITHGKIVNQQGDAACLKCHAEVEPSCAKCHTSR